MHYFTSKDHRLNLYYDINYYQPLISEIENEAESISKGVSYMVNDFTSADSIAMASRMDDKLYMEALQRLSYRIRACANRINEITMTLACNVLDPSAQTQITWNEINHQISDLIHSLEVSYNNLRWIYLYIKGEVHIPESHVMQLLVIPYMDFSEDELPEDKNNDDNESPEEGDTDSEESDEYDESEDDTDSEESEDSEDSDESDESTEPEENSSDDTAKLKYKKITLPIDKKIMNDIESRYPKIGDPSEVKTNFDRKDIEKIITDRVEALKNKNDTTSDSSEEKIDRNTWIIGGVVVDAKYLPVKTDDPKEAWIICPNYETDLVGKYECKYEFVRYDQEAQKWVTVQSDKDYGITDDDAALYVYASLEAGCFGKVSKREYLPKCGRLHSEIYCEENKTNYRYDYVNTSKENSNPEVICGWFDITPDDTPSDAAPNI